MTVGTMTEELNEPTIEYLVERITREVLLHLQDAQQTASAEANASTQNTIRARAGRLSNADTAAPAPRPTSTVARTVVNA